MSIITHLLNQTGNIVDTTTDKHGDQKVSSKTAVPMRFRYITEIDKGIGREAINSDAMVWLEPDVSIQEGSLIEYDSKYWRVQRLVIARNFGPNVQFYKAFVDKHTL